ncbi:spore germination protein [Paenibacillus rhizoplanae]
MYSLQEGRTSVLLEEQDPDKKIEILTSRVLMAGDLTVVQDYAQFVHDLLSGNVMLMVEGTASALRIGLPGWEDRGCK